MSVALIVNDSGNLVADDTGVRDLLQANAWTVDVVQHSGTPSIPSASTVIVVSASVTDGTASNYHAYRDAEQGVVGLSHATAALRGLALAEARAARGVGRVDVIDSAHELANGHSASFDVNSTVANQFGATSANTGPDAAEVLRIQGNAEYSLFGYEQDDVGYDSHVFTKRAVCVGWMYGDSLTNVTTDGENVFLNAVSWAETDSSQLATPTNFTFAKVDDTRQIDSSADTVTDANSYELEWQEWDGAAWQPMSVESNASPSFTLTDADGVDWDTLYRGRMRALP